ncbi:MAG: methylmalonyl Co-A mutase-associated GTPase MeaB [Hyphomicrobiales bacterium]
MSPTFAGIALEDILAGRKTSVAAALNLLENRRPEVEELAVELIETLAHHARAGRHVIGVTGPPGAGKSTLISRLVHEYRLAGFRVGVITVDPSSPRSGGALLGDRARIDCDPADPGLFIRSMAAGRHLGGLAWRTRHCLALFEAAFDRILVETTGVGQSETEIENVADTVVYVVQPGSGDSLQFMKAGIMEIPHVLVVNKADHKNLALKVYHELQALAGAGCREDGWEPALILASALEGWGQKELVEALEARCRHLKADDLAKLRREHRIRWVYLLFLERFGSHGVERLGGEGGILERLRAADLDNPFRALEDLAGDAGSCRSEGI